MVDDPNALIRQSEMLALTDRVIAAVRALEFDPSMVGEATSAALSALASASAANTDRAATEAARDEAMVITGLTGEDTAVAYIVDDPNSAATAALQSAYKVRESSIGVGGRGMISLVLDDGQPSQYTDILPISIAMGFPMGTAWCTGNGQDEPVTRAHAAGWEVMSHTRDHDRMTELTDAQLVADAEYSIAKIAAITGTTRNIAFVYPEHNRDRRTDRVLSRYYT